MPPYLTDLDDAETTSRAEKSLLSQWHCISACCEIQHVVTILARPSFDKVLAARTGTTCMADSDVASDHCRMTAPTFGSVVNVI